MKTYVIIADNGWSISSNWQNYKNIIKEISLEAEKNKKRNTFLLFIFKKFEKPIFLILYTEIIEFLNNNPPISITV